ncbi:GspH/FimT family pseudopilin [Roseateles toxinivorans]|uniref:Type II secretion system protein H n=1 Tax=Roseateles toxinivorans TaxID=270368 RepID=A0A4R6QJ65_9BURK|nr:GspH/FimT family pseudopilin [Roseateles toxinivorans]TDP62780.1 type IV fimbrial biogenesis protein FimT [Roseateles toxinivorans]
MLIGRTPRRQLGFSLIETVVAMAVLVFMLAMAMPEAVSWIQGLKVRNAAEGIRSGIERARMEALKTNGNVGFWLVADASSKVPGNGCDLASNAATWVVSVTTPAGACAAEPSMTAGPRLVQSSGAVSGADRLTVTALSATDAAATRVRFNGLGQVIVEAGAIQVVDVVASNGDGRRLRVVVETGGAVRMCDRDVAADDPRACPVL